MEPTRDRVLRVDLTAGSVESERVPERWRRRYLGGKGLGARYLYESLAPGTDPLGPDNVLGFVLGPLSGFLPGEQRYAAVTRSPLTGTFLDSYAGGDFPTVLAGALDDHVALLVTGAADEPVRIELADGSASVKPATSVWGRDAAETAAAFDGAVACIGPAGENRVSCATIASDGAEHHAGRGGAGAVMGSKRLAAVVARGDAPEPSDDLADLEERDRQAFLESDTGRWLTASETLESVDVADHTGVLSARGWQDRGFEGAADVGVEAARKAAHDRERDDPIPGGFRIDTDEGETVPRGATGMTLGAGLGIDEFDAVAELGERCNRLGLDLIGAGNAVAWVVRAADAGLVDRDVSFGDPAAARRLLEEIARRRTPLGDALADGVPAAAERYGGEGFIPTVKGMALPSYDPRGAASMALAYATSDRGACHRRARPVEREALDGPMTPGEVTTAVIEAQTVRSLRWSLIADDFAGEVLADRVTDWLDAVGHPYDDLARTGERIWNLVRLFNVREGFDRSDDDVPDALETDGALSEAQFEASLSVYYAARGWGSEGRPARETLDRLDLLHVVDAATPVADEPLDPAEIRAIDP